MSGITGKSVAEEIDELCSKLQPQERTEVGKKFWEIRRQVEEELPLGEWVATSALECDNQIMVQRERRLRELYEKQIKPLYTT
jgi:hypothetical protein